MSKKSDKKKPGLFVRILRVVGCVLLAIVLIFAGLIGYLTITEYDPDDVIALEAQGSADDTLEAGDSFTLMSWNMGYAALGDNADFFMDGGSGVITADEDRVSSNMAGIIEEIESVDPDIFFLQEIDRDSKRSHHMDELSGMQENFDDYTSVFANNYKVSYVPYPVPTLGKVDSGIATFSEYGIENCERIQLPISFSWPVRTANLKRCLLVSRVPVEGTDKELVLVNLHLEAYDSGEGKIAQTKMLAELLNQEYEKGNYVIAGGDFNQIFSSANEEAYPLKEGMWHPGVIDISEIKGDWNFLMDESVPSCRSLDQPYAGADHSDFQYYLIDGFIVSGNITVDEFSNEDLEFVCSDHNPVVLKATLN